MTPSDAGPFYARTLCDRHSIEAKAKHKESSLAAAQTRKAGKNAADAWFRQRDAEASAQRVASARTAAQLAIREYEQAKAEALRIGVVS